MAAGTKSGRSKRAGEARLPAQPRVGSPPTPRAYRSLTRLSVPAAKESDVQLAIGVEVGDEKVGTCATPRAAARLLWGSQGPPMAECCCHCLLQVDSALGVAVAVAVQVPLPARASKRAKKGKDVHVRPCQPSTARTRVPEFPQHASALAALRR